jgi:hypothetical protein
MAEGYTNLYKVQLVDLAADKDLVETNFTGAKFDKDGKELLNYTEL